MRRFALIAALISALIGSSDANAQSRRGGGFVGALIGAGIAAALGSGAAAKPSEKDYKDGILRPAQLKECLLTAHRMDLEEEELEFQATKIDSENSSIDRTKAQLELDALYPVSSQFEVDKVNQQIHMFNARLHAQQYTIDIYNQRVRGHSGEVAKWNQACADHRFFLHDLNGMKAEIPFNIDQYIKRS